MGEILEWYVLNSRDYIPSVDTKKRNVTEIISISPAPPPVIQTYFAHYT